MPNALTWDDDGRRTYELGTKKGVLFVMGDDGTYADGVAWEGLTSVTASNSGGEENALWADDIKYASIRSAEEFGGTIEAYKCPREFYPCDGMATIATGVTIGQQRRKKFGFSYVTTIGNDVDELDYGYKIHLVYGASVSPSERQYQTVNDSPEAMTLSWEFTTTPVKVPGYRPTAHLIIDSTIAAPEKIAALETILYGSSNASARLPLPSEVATILTTGTSTGTGTGN